MECHDMEVTLLRVKKEEEEDMSLRVQANGIQ
jgi:hypothetical protein